MICTANGTFAQRVKIQPHYSVAYVQNIEYSFRKSIRPEFNKSKGMLSKKSIMRMRNALNWMLYFALDKVVYSRSKKRAFKFKLNFITLTLSTAQKHSDTYILHRMVFPFLKFLSRKYQVHTYVWRAEIQGKRLKERGERCVHFHITTDRFVHWQSIRNKWNSLQHAHGYIESASDPNSTDVHSVRATGKIISYITKYMTKQEEKDAEKVTCKIFGMSRNLTMLNLSMKEEEDENFYEEISEFVANNTREKKSMKHGMLYFNSLTRKSELPKGIERKMLALSEVYYGGVDEVTKHYIE